MSVVIDPKPLELVLSTWFVMYLLGDRPGGLPNDFLSKGATSLLLVDHVVCDEDGLAAEKRFEKVWLSSDIFIALEREGILRPKRLKEYLGQPLGDLFSTGAAQVLVDWMDRERTSMRTLQDSQLELPGALSALNSSMFMRLSLEMPDLLLYGWQENYFRVPDHLATFSDQTGGKARAPESTPSSVERAMSTVDVIAAFRARLPTIDLLPPLDDYQKSLMAENSIQERRMLFSWILGDPSVSRDAYHEFRLGRGFRKNDELIDDSRRRKLAQANLERLLRARQETQDLRKLCQAVISDLIEGRRELSDVEKEINDAQADIIEKLGSSVLTSMSLSMASVNLIASLIELVILKLTGFPLGPYSTATMFQPFVDAKLNNDLIGGLRKTYPLPFLIAESRKILREKQP